MPHKFSERLLTGDRHREAFKRGMLSLGTMVKSSAGMAATNGILHRVAAHVDSVSKGKTPSPMIASRIIEQKALRVQINQARPSMSCQKSID